MISNEKSETLHSQDTIEYSLNHKLKKRQRRKIVCTLCLCFYFLVLLFYFALPPFQCKNLKAKGNLNLTREDCIALSENNGYRPLLFLNSKSSAEKLISHSYGLIENATIKSNGFQGQIDIVEDYPHGKYVLGNNIISYSLSGKTSDELLLEVEKLSLSAERKSEIKKSILSESENVPLIHLPSNIDISLDSIKKGVEPLSVLPFSSLSVFSDIQYLNDSGDSTFNNVADILIEKDGIFLLLKDCLTDYFSYYFSSSNFPDSLITSLKRESSHMEKKDYVFKDTNQTVSAYWFQAYVDSEKKVRWVEYKK